MELFWADYLSVGNGVIDSDHKNLIAVIYRVEQAITARDRDALAKAFWLLDSSMYIHFRNEEKIAAAVNFPFAKNGAEHQQLMHEMRQMLRDLESMYSFWPDDLVQTYSTFLNGWIADHIIKTDMQMKPVLLTHPYDLKPD